MIVSQVQLKSVATPIAGGGMEVAVKPPTTTASSSARLAMLRKTSQSALTKASDEEKPKEVRQLLTQFPSVEHWFEEYHAMNMEYMAALSDTSVALSALDELPREEAPTLGLFLAAYEGDAIRWMSTHLSYINFMAGTQNKMNDIQRANLARDIANTFPYTNIAEFAVFCRRAANGHTFGPIEYAVNPTKIGAWYDEYVLQIRDSVAETEKLRTQEQIAENKKILNSPEMLVTIQKYCKNAKAKLGGGDISAEQKLANRRRFDQEQRRLRGWVTEDSDIMKASLKHRDPEFIKKRDEAIAMLKAQNPDLKTPEPPKD